MSFATVAQASAEPTASTATFKGGILALGSSVMAGMQGGTVTLHDTHTPTPPPPPLPDHHPTPPPPPPPDHHPTPPPPPPPDHHPTPPPPPPPDHHPTPPPPPPPPDHHPLPPPPPPPAQAPRDEIVSWVGDNSDPTDEDDGQVIDLSQVSGTATDNVVDAGVTSGSDSSVWDPIHVGPDH